MKKTTFIIKLKYLECSKLRKIISIYTIELFIAMSMDYNIIMHRSELNIITSNFYYGFVTFNIKNEYILFDD